jgi:hypothetical protein
VNVAEKRSRAVEPKPLSPPLGREPQALPQNGSPPVWSVSLTLPVLLEDAIGFFSDSANQVKRCSDVARTEKRQRHYPLGFRSGRIAETALGLPASPCAGPVGNCPSPLFWVLCGAVEQCFIGASAFGRSRRGQCRAFPLSTFIASWNQGT